MSRNLFDNQALDLRPSVVASHGAGIDPKTFRVEGLDADILWPGAKGLPAIGVAVMLRRVEGGWTYAGAA